MPALFTRISICPKGAFRIGEQPLDICRLGDIALDRGGLAAAARDLGDHLARGVPARRVVHDDGGACRRQLTRNLGPDPFGSAGDHRDLVRKLAH
jgi:hypothetical protein